jgi:uncharacterized membrane protein YkvA (DUF1232 family)
MAAVFIRGERKLRRLKEKIRSLKAEIYCLYYAARHPRTPWYAKILVSFIAAYALSPIDLIPDFVPVLGYLDDLVLIPLGIFLAIRLIPPQVLEECRSRAQEIFQSDKPVSWTAGAAIILIWLAAAVLCFWYAYEVFKSK